MANSITHQILQDGPRNVVLKVEGVLDTADIGAGTSLTSGVTTTGSTAITFAANTVLVPGQFISGTGIPAGAYVVSNTTTTAVISAAATAANTGLTFTVTAGNTVILDPALRSAKDNATGNLATKLRINRIVHNIEDSLSINLFWNATTPVRIEQLTGQGEQDFDKLGGLVNNAGAGVDGKILMASQGWATSAILHFSVVLHCIKQ